jgi:hypothetical protein
MQRAASELSTLPQAFEKLVLDFGREGGPSEGRAKQLRGLLIVFHPNHALEKLEVITGEPGTARCALRIERQREIQASVAKEERALIRLQLNVVGRCVELDELELQQSRLQRAFAFLRADFVDLGEQLSGTARESALFLEVAVDPSMQGARFAHIEDALIGAKHGVDARSFADGESLLSGDEQIEAASLRSDGLLKQAEDLLQAMYSRRLKHAGQMFPHVEACVDMLLCSTQALEVVGEVSCDGAQPVLWQLGEEPSGQLMGADDGERPWRLEELWQGVTQEGELEAGEVDEQGTLGEQRAQRLAE